MPWYLQCSNCPVTAASAQTLACELPEGLVCWLGTCPFKVDCILQGSNKPCQVWSGAYLTGVVQSLEDTVNLRGQIPSQDDRVPGSLQARV